MKKNKPYAANLEYFNFDSPQVKIRIHPSLNTFSLRNTNKELLESARISAGFSLADDIEKILSKKKHEMMK